jgi:hypothetical protein
MAVGRGEVTWDGSGAGITARTGAAPCDETGFGAEPTAGAGRTTGSKVGTGGEAEAGVEMSCKALSSAGRGMGRRGLGDPNEACILSTRCMWYFSGLGRCYIIKLWPAELGGLSSKIGMGGVEYGPLVDEQASKNYLRIICST